MKILFVTIDSPENRTRLRNHIKTTQNAGHTVVLAANFKYKSKFSEYGNANFHTAFESGPLKFILFNIKLACYLLLHRYDCLYLRGIYVVPGARVAAFFKNKHMMYDAHKYFAGLSLVQKRLLRRIIWMAFERWIVRNASSVLTVSEPIAQQYRARYQALKRITVIRNLPGYQIANTEIPEPYQLRYTQKVILFFGYLMPDRGLTCLLKAVADIPDVVLLIVGEGEMKSALVALSESMALSGRVKFMPFVPYKYLISFISQAYIGVSLLKPVSDNHRYALPNKLFECIMAGLPVLASDIPTHRFYINTYGVGLTVDVSSHVPVRKCLKEMLSDHKQWQQWHENCLQAAKELNWENEEVKLKAELEIINNQMKNNVD